MNLRRLSPDAAGALCRELGLDPVRAFEVTRIVQEYRDWASRAEAARESGEYLPFPADMQDKLDRVDDLLGPLIDEPPRMEMPWPTLAKMIGHFYGGEILVLAGATATGKTVTTMNLAMGLVGQGRRVLLCSTEENRWQVRTYVSGLDNHFRVPDLMNRDYLAAGYGRLPAAEVKRRCAVSITHYNTLALTPERAPLLTHRRPVWHATDFSLIFAKAEHDRRDVVIIDHLGMVKHNLPARTQFDAEMETLREIQRLAVSYNVTVVLLAQVNVKLHRQGDTMARFRPPELTHIYGGQFISFIATTVLTIYRPSVTVTADGRTVTTAVVREFLRDGKIGDLYERGTTAFYVAKHRRETEIMQGRLRYHAGHLVELDTDLNEWLEQSPAAQRQAAATRGDAWEPPGIDAEFNDGKTGD